MKQQTKATKEVSVFTYTKKQKDNLVALGEAEMEQARRQGDMRKVKRMEKRIAEVRALPEAK